MNETHEGRHRAIRAEVAAQADRDLARAIDRVLASRLPPGPERLRAEGWLGEHAAGPEPIEVAAVVIVRR